MREMKALCRGTKPGDRRVFYCMNLRISALTIIGADTAPLD